MAYGITFEIDAHKLQEAMFNLESLPSRRVNPAVKQAVNAASREVAKVAKTLAPRKTGHLRASISVKMLGMKRDGSIRAIVGPRMKKFKDGSNPGRYGHLVEAGTKPHIILPKFKKVLMWKGKMQVSYTKKVNVLGGKLAVEKTRNKKFQVFTQQVNHPGIRPRNFLRTAAHNAQGRALRAFVEKLQNIRNKYSEDAGNA